MSNHNQLTRAKTSGSIDCKKIELEASDSINSANFDTSQPVTPLLRGKLLQEYQTIEAMVSLYCHRHHSTSVGVLCATCSHFCQYAHTKLDRCPYGQHKPTCNKCPVHCYKPVMRDMAKTIMVYAGPRMILHHPIMAIRHLLAERGATPDLPPAGASNRHARLKNLHE